MQAGIEVPKAKNGVVLREEFEDCSLLFDPSSGRGYCINAVATQIWKALKAGGTLEEIRQSIADAFRDSPPNPDADIAAFLDEIVREGLAERARY